MLFLLSGGKMKKLLSYFTKGELALWFASIAVITISFFIFDREGYLTLIASLIGATSLIFNAKGNPIGPFLMIIFGIIYGIISITFSYYGEMITYVGMTVPMSFFSFIAWIKNPYKGKLSEVTVNRLKRKDIVGMLVFTVVVTVTFYFILAAFHTANLLPSTLSVATSFLAVLLTYKRSPYYALVYAANDVVLILLWTLAAVTDINYLSVIICFVTFLVNDIYGFISWRKMQNKQNEAI